MSSYSEYIKSMKEKEINRFFGEVKRSSNKYFTFNHVLDEDNFIVVTANIKVIKGSYVLIVGKNQGVYLKDWQVVPVHNDHEGFNAYAVKLNRNFFKIYTFKSNFDDMTFTESDTFDSLKAIAEMQNDIAIALKHMKLK